MQCECSRPLSSQGSNSCDPMRKRSTTRSVRQEGFGRREKTGNGSARIAIAAGVAEGRPARRPLLLAGLQYPMGNLEFTGLSPSVAAVVAIGCPILTRGGGARVASRASHNRSHSAPGNFIAMASTPDASRLRREVDFRGPKKEGRGRDCLIATNRRTPARLTTAGSTNIHIL